MRYPNIPEEELRAEWAGTPIEPQFLICIL